MSSEHDDAHVRSLRQSDKSVVQLEHQVYYCQKKSTKAAQRLIQNETQNTRSHLNSRICHITTS